MEKSNLNWVVVFISTLIVAISFLIRTSLFAGFGFENIETTVLIVLIEILFYGIFFRIYETQFFKEHWSWPIFLHIFIPFCLTSMFYFFQNSVFLTYTTWIVWVLAIIWGQFFLFDSNEEEDKKLWNLILGSTLAIWITGFAFPELGSIQLLGFNYATNIYFQIPFLRWVVDLRSIFTLLFFVAVLLKPLFSMDWKLDKFGTEYSAPIIPDHNNTFTILIKAIENGIIRANNYLNRIILHLKVLSKRYSVEFLISLKQISLRTYSILLMTVSLISVFILSKIISLLSEELYSFIKSLTLSENIGHFVFIIFYVACIYLILILNWLLFNENIFFKLESIKKFNNAIWYVFNEYIQILILKIPGFLFIISLITWIIVFVYNSIANKPFIFPSIFLVICLTVFIVYFIYYKIQLNTKKR